ncbi:MAG: esterase-like activity of phytase family protein [Proteobacteria bacterium]|nr:esterase-like activity of phytase family protein [Pseudomonadota bacterium]
MARLFPRLLLACLFAVSPALADSTPIQLHNGLSEQDRVGRLVWRGGIEMIFADPRFGGISAMEIDPGGRTLTVLTDRGHRAELFLEYDLAGDLSAAKLVDLEPVLGAVGRSIDDDRNSDIEAIARMPDGGWLVAFERNHRLAHYPASFAPLRAAPRLLLSPPGLERARSNIGIKAASETADKKILLIAEDLKTSRAFTFAWLGNGAEWTPMAYTLFPPYKPAGAALLPNGDIIVVERRFTPPSDVGSRIARIAQRGLRPGAPIQTIEIARLEPPFVTENFEAVTARSAGRGQTLIYLASDNNFSDNQRNLLLMFELLP